MINFHRPATWQREGFTLRAPNAQPRCGDLCFVWDGTPEALRARLEEAGARWKKVRSRARVVAGRTRRVYVRDPDGNLLEFMFYP
jgi:catechol 2,3-dioxygenase-like lactoylglutathione lyase family enzyme